MHRLWNIELLDGNLRIVLSVRGSGLGIAVSHFHVLAPGNSACVCKATLRIVIGPAKPYFDRPTAATKKRSKKTTKRRAIETVYPDEADISKTKSKPTIQHQFHHCLFLCNSCIVDFFRGCEFNFAIAVERTWNWTLGNFALELRPLLTRSKPVALHLWPPIPLCFVW